MERIARAQNHHLRTEFDHPDFDCGDSLAASWAPDTEPVSSRRIVRVTDVEPLNQELLRSVGADDVVLKFLLAGDEVRTRRTRTPGTCTCTWVHTYIMRGARPSVTCGNSPCYLWLQPLLPLVAGAQDTLPAARLGAAVLAAGDRAGAMYI